MKKRYIHVLMIVAICGLLAVVFSGKEKQNAKTAAKGIVPVSTVGKRSAIQPNKEKKSVEDIPPTVVIFNGVFVVDTREKLVYGTPAMEQYRLGDRCQAALHGAEAKVTLRVVDTEGKEVPDASVNLTFAFRQKNKPLIGLTDSNGLFVAQGTLTEDIIYRVTKAGYYETFDRFFMAKAATRCVENGRWIPWNPTLQVTLKEKRRPIPMYVKKVRIRVPDEEINSWFDFEKGDWISPQGKGERKDVLITYLYSAQDRQKYHNVIYRFPNTTDGIYRKCKDNSSLFCSDYEAKETTYCSSNVFELVRLETGITKDTRVSADEYLVFRIRSLKNENSNFIEGNYGKIYGPIKIANFEDRLIEFTYYFNPTPNDRNLEFDGKNNLFNPKWNDSWNTNVP
ncbi:MAG: hypothetical protein WCO26_21440 [Deltaproteobacteria bacterium]